MNEIYITDQIYTDMKNKNLIIIEFYDNSNTIISPEIETKYADIKFYRCSINTGLSLTKEFKIKKLPSLVFLIGDNYLFTLTDIENNSIINSIELMLQNQNSKGDLR